MKELKINNRTSVKGLIHQKTIDYLETEEEKKTILNIEINLTKLQILKKYTIILSILI